MRIAAIADIHYDAASQGKHGALFRTISDDADILLLCGDLTDHGLVEEAEVLADDLRAHVRIPMLGVLGNHDFESGQADELVQAVRGAGVRMLDGDAVEIDGVGFAGTPGFAGGFDEWALSPWGEPAIKEFVQATVEESLKLEQALSRLQTEERVVLLHYAPIRETVVGEPPEIFPFLGSSRLEDPLNHYGASVAFHGHAHHGSPEGRTSGGTPVYNVSIPVLSAAYADRPPFRVFELQPDEKSHV